MLGVEQDARIPSSQVRRTFEEPSSELVVGERVNFAGERMILAGDPGSDDPRSTDDPSCEEHIGDPSCEEQRTSAGIDFLRVLRCGFPPSEWRSECSRLM